MEQRELPELTPETIRAVSRVMSLFLVAGVVVGVAGLFAAEWVASTLGDAVMIPYLPGLLAMVGAMVLVPAIAAALGFYEGRRGVSQRLVGEVGLGVWIGSVLYGMIVLFLLSVTISGDIGPAYIEYVSLAGLVSITAVVGGVTAVSSRDFVIPDTTTTDTPEPEPAEPEPAESPQESVATPMGGESLDEDDTAAPEPSDGEPESPSPFGGEEEEPSETMDEPDHDEEVAETDEDDAEAVSEPDEPAEDDESTADSDEDDSDEDDDGPEESPFTFG